MNWDEAIHSQRAHALRSKKDHSGVTSGWKLMKVCKFKVERKKHPAFAFGSSSDLDIGLTQQAFIFSGYTFMALLDDNEF
jgi:hypothetical protein